MTDLSIVIVSYNTCDLLRECLDSIAATTRGLTYEVIVVDNASEDGSEAMVATEFPAVRLVTLGENLGYGKACNLGVAESSSNDVALLNPDTVVHEGAMERLVAFARANPGAGIIGGRTLRPSGEVDPGSCWAQPTLWSLCCYATGLSKLFRHSRVFDPESMGRWQRDSVREVGVVTGCLLLAPRAVWDRLGGFDERFWMYSEDTDLSARARALGYRPMITPDAVVTHYVGASSVSPSWRRQLVLAGKVAFVDKHWPRRRAFAGRRLLVSGVALRAAAAGIARRHGSPWPEVWRSRRGWVRGWPSEPSRDDEVPAPAPAA